MVPIHIDGSATLCVQTEQQAEGELQLPLSTRAPHHPVFLLVSAVETRDEVVCKWGEWERGAETLWSGGQYWEKLLFVKSLWKKGWREWGGEGREIYN